MYGVQNKGHKSKDFTISMYTFYEDYNLTMQN